MSYTYIIAEAGVNHNGDIQLAQQMIDVAREAGCDAVKFQTFKAESLVTKTAQKAAYQKKNTANEDSQYSMLKALELDETAHEILVKQCQKSSIDFLSSAFDLEAIDYLKQMNMPFFKVPSGEITNRPYLEKVAQSGKPVILSTGMSNLAEVEAAIAVMSEAGLQKEDLTVLHCNTEYPTPFKDVNLLAMNQMARDFGVKVGYSDHTPGIEVAIAAVALGAVVIEKHFTLDKTMSGPDHRASLEPEELKAMVAGIRNVEFALQGSGVKEPSASEAKNIVIARKSIVASKIIRKGDVIKEHMITAKRPASGISPMRWYEVVGATADRDYEVDQPIIIES